MCITKVHNLNSFIHSADMWYLTSLFSFLTVFSSPEALN